MIDAMHLYRIYSKIGPARTITCACGVIFITYANGYGEVCMMCNYCIVNYLQKKLKNNGQL